MGWEEDYSVITEANSVIQGRKEKMREVSLNFDRRLKLYLMK